MKCERILLKIFFNLFNLNKKLIFKKTGKIQYLFKKKFLILKNN